MYLGLNFKYYIFSFYFSDDYFVERVKVIDELAEQRKKKVLEIVDWNDRFKVRLNDVFPDH